MQEPYLEDERFKEYKSGTLFQIKVITNAKKNEVIGWQENFLKIRITAIPEKGRANEEILSFLAKYTSLKKSQLSIYLGDTSNKKTLLVENISPQELKEKLPKK